MHLSALAAPPWPALRLWRTETCCVIFVSLAFTSGIHRKLSSSTSSSTPMSSLPDSPRRAESTPRKAWHHFSHNPLSTKSPCQSSRAVAALKSGELCPSVKHESHGASIATCFLRPFWTASWQLVLRCFSLLHFRYMNTDGNGLPPGDPVVWVSVHLW